MTDSRTFGRARLEVARGDLTREDTDAIVNAANSTLMGGGGVDGAIHRAGGGAILEECRALRAGPWPDGLPEGEAALTTGGRLAARHVIHTVGPVWRGGTGGEPEILARCYRNSLELAEGRHLASVAFPSISTGAYGYPIEKAAPVALAAIANGLRAARSLRLVRCVLFSPSDLEVYRRALAALPD